MTCFVRVMISAVSILITIIIDLDIMEHNQIDTL